VESSPGVAYNQSTPFAYTDLADLDFVQSVDVMYFAHQSYFPRKMERASATSMTFSNIDIDPTHSAPSAGFSVTASGTSAGTETTDYTYVVSTVIDGQESEPSSDQTISGAKLLDYEGQEITISWTAVSGADSYNVYRKRGGSYGYIGFTEGTSFIDDNISPDMSITPIEASGLFTTSADYPATVTLFQQRLIFANSTSLPETIWASRTGAYENFTKSAVLKDSDRIEFDITGGSINEVQWMIQLRELLVFCSTGEWSIIGPNGGLPATNAAQTQYGYSGSGDVKPLVAEDTALFVDRTKRGVRDLRYAFEQDGYTGNDLALFAYHYLEGRQIKHWALQKNPYSIVWVALDDGTLLSLTYKREHQVWAWARHDVGGDVESLAVIQEGDEDSLYMIVKRTINGGTKRYVERLHSRQFSALEDCFFVDCGITYDGASTTTITGLSHLEAETVSVLADGEVVSGLTVSSGQITLPTAASKVHVGLPYTAEIETLPPAIELKDVGNARGRPIKASRAFIQCENTLKIKAGYDRDKLHEYAHSEAGLYTGTIQVQLYPDWNRDGTIVVRQSYPLPMTILGIGPDFSIGRTEG
jgi:hypothetical protein